jgi:hypothetical protein
MKPQAFLIFSLALVLLGLCSPGIAQKGEASGKSLISSYPEKGIGTRISVNYKHFLRRVASCNRFKCGIALAEADDAPPISEVVCAADEFQCADKSRCIPKSYICDEDKVRIFIS